MRTTPFLAVAVALTVPAAVQAAPLDGYAVTKLDVRGQQSAFLEVGDDIFNASARMAVVATGRAPFRGGRATVGVRSRLDSGGAFISEIAEWDCGDDPLEADPPATVAVTAEPDGRYVRLTWALPQAGWGCTTPALLIDVETKPDPDGAPPPATPARPADPKGLMFTRHPLSSVARGAVLPFRIAARWRGESGISMTLTWHGKVTLKRR